MKKDDGDWRKAGGGILLGLALFGIGFHVGKDPEEPHTHDERTLVDQYEGAAFGEFRASGLHCLITVPVLPTEKKRARVVPDARGDEGFVFLEKPGVEPKTVMCSKSQWDVIRGFDRPGRVFRAKKK